MMHSISALQAGVPCRAAMTKRSVGGGRGLRAALSYGPAPCVRARPRVFGPQPAAMHRRAVRVAVDWRKGGGMPPPGKLFASEEDYGEDFNDVSGSASERKVGVVKWFNVEKVTPSRSLADGSVTGRLTEGVRVLRHPSQQVHSARLGR